MDFVIPPVMYHQPQSPAQLAGIAAHGLLPGSDLDNPRYEGFYASRPGCVYMGSTLSGPKSMVLFRPVIKVDTAQLDPALFAADEDYFAIYTWGCREDTHIDIAYDLPDCFERRDGVTYWRKDGPLERPPSRVHKHASLGQWAERNAQVLDRPDAVAMSIKLGSVAYRGPIPRSAISINDDEAWGWMLLMGDSSNSREHVRALQACLDLGAGGPDRVCIENALRRHADRLAGIAAC